MEVLDFSSILRLNVSPFNNALDESGNTAEGVFQRIGTAAVDYFGARGVIGMFERATKASAEFEQSIADMGAITDLSMEQVRKAIMKMPNYFGHIQDVSDTMYEVVSSGFRGINALNLEKFQKSISMAARTIRADVYATGDAMTTLANAYKLNMKQIETLPDWFYLTVREGKAHGNELARTLGLVINNAAEAGVELSELGGAISILSRTQSASQSMIGLNQMLNSLIKPTLQAKAAAREWGIELGAEALEAKGFTATLQELHDKVGGNVEALEKMFGNIRAGRAILTLTGKQFEDFMQVIGEYDQGLGTGTEAFKKQIDTANTAFENLHNQAAKTFAEIGKDVEPATKGLAGLGEAALKGFTGSDAVSKYTTYVIALHFAVTKLTESLQITSATLSGVATNIDRTASAVENLTRKSAVANATLPSNMGKVSSAITNKGTIADKTASTALATKALASGSGNNAQVVKKFTEKYPVTFSPKTVTPSRQLTYLSDTSLFNTQSTAAKSKALAWLSNPGNINTLFPIMSSPAAVNPQNVYNSAVRTAPITPQVPLWKSNPLLASTAMMGRYYGEQFANSTPSVAKVFAQKEFGRWVNDPSALYHQVSNQVAKAKAITFPQKYTLPEELQDRFIHQFKKQQKINLAKRTLASFFDDSYFHASEIINPVKRIYGYQFPLGLQEDFASTFKKGKEVKLAKRALASFLADSSNASKLIPTKHINIFSDSARAEFDKWISDPNLLRKRLLRQYRQVLGVRTNVLQAQQGKESWVQGAFKNQKPNIRRGYAGGRAFKMHGNNIGAIRRNLGTYQGLRSMDFGDLRSRALFQRQHGAFINAHRWGDIYTGTQNLPDLLKKEQELASLPTLAGYMMKPQSRFSKFLDSSKAFGHNAAEHITSGVGRFASNVRDPRWDMVDIHGNSAAYRLGRMRMSKLLPKFNLPNGSFLGKTLDIGKGLAKGFLAPVGRGLSKIASVAGAAFAGVAVADIGYNIGKSIADKFNFADKFLGGKAKEQEKALEESNRQALQKTILNQIQSSKELTNSQKIDLANRATLADSTKKLKQVQNALIKATERELQERTKGEQQSRQEKLLNTTYEKNLGEYNGLKGRKSDIGYLLTVGAYRKIYGLLQSNNLNGVPKELIQAGLKDQFGFINVLRDLQGIGDKGGTVAGVKFTKESATDTITALKQIMKEAGLGSSYSQEQLVAYNSEMAKLTGNLLRSSLNKHVAQQRKKLTDKGTDLSFSGLSDQLDEQAEYVSDLSNEMSGVTQASLYKSRQELQESTDKLIKLQNAMDNIYTKGREEFVKLTAGMDKKAKAKLEKQFSAQISNSTSGMREELLNTGASIHKQREAINRKEKQYTQRRVQELYKGITDNIGNDLEDANFDTTKAMAGLTKKEKGKLENRINNTMDIIANAEDEIKRGGNVAYNKQIITNNRARLKDDMALYNRLNQDLGGYEGTELERIRNKAVTGHASESDVLDASEKYYSNRLRDINANTNMARFNKDVDQLNKLNKERVKVERALADIEGRRVEVENKRATETMSSIGGFTSDQYKGRLSNQALYHSMNLMSRLSPALSMGLKSGTVGGTLSRMQYAGNGYSNVQNAQNAQTQLAATMDAYAIEQKYANADIGKNVKRVVELMTENPVIRLR